MKKYLATIYIAVIFMVFFSGCAGENTSMESSAEQISVVSQSLTHYEKQALSNAVEIPLQNACKTLYEGVRKGSITQESVAGKFSFADSLPGANASPNQKIKAADLLTLRNALEYFSLDDVYTDENIRQYGYMTVNCSDLSLAKGTVVDIAKFETVSENFIRFDTLDITFGSFISGSSLQ